MDNLGTLIQFSILVYEDDPICMQIQQVDKTIRCQMGLNYAYGLRGQLDKAIRMAELTAKMEG